MKRVSVPAHSIRIVAMIIATGVMVQAKTPPPVLTLSYEPSGWLVIHGNHLPGKSLRIHYVETYCRAGSTNADWGQHTAMPYQAQLLSLSDDKKILRLQHKLQDGLVIDHQITAASNKVRFDLTAHNPGSVRSEAHWAQPCIQIARFTGSDDPHAYLTKCFIFLDGQPVRLADVQPWATQARYTPGQVWCAPNVPKSDVNPRPLSPLTTDNGLIGAVSADNKMLVATAWHPYQELFQGVIQCIHADYRLGGLEPNETKQIRGIIYLMPNKMLNLLENYTHDFPEHRYK